MKLRSTILAGAALALLTTTAYATVYTVPSDVSAGHMNIRSGPGTNHSLLAAIPAGATVNAGRCVPRDDGIRGADWCIVTYNGVTGWVSTAGLMPGYASGEPPHRPNQPISPDWDSGPYAAMPAPTMTVQGYSLQCTPSLDRSDRNPVKNIWVSFDFDWTNMKMLGMSVNHERWNGELVDRFSQYREASINYEQGIFGWKGSWVKNHDHIMAGGAFEDRDGRWFYREKSWTNGVPDYDLTVPCVVYEAQ